MYTQVSLHYVNPGQMEKAMETFKKNTQIARKLKGFVSRDILVSQSDPTKVTSVTSWKTKEDLEAFAKNPTRPKIVREQLFSKVEGEVYHSVD